MCVSQVLLTCIAMATAPASRHGPPPLLDPQSYRSPSKRVVLEVDPSDRLARGPARYRLSRDGSEVWSRELPWTLWQATVAEDGTAAGYAYTQGEQDVHAAGDLVVAVLDPSGKVACEHRTQREKRPLFSATITVPHARGIFLDSDRGRFVVRVGHYVEHQYEGEEWWTYPLAGGERDAVVPVDDERFGGLFNEVRAVPGTGLILARIGWTPVCSYLLLDGALQPLWKEERRHPVAADASAAERAALTRWLSRNGGMIPCPAPGRFDLRFPDGEVTSYEAVRDGSASSGWKVREISRRREPIRLDTPPRVEPEPIVLSELGEVWIGRDSPPARSAIRDVLAWEFDREGYVELIRAEHGEGRGHSWARVDTLGRLIEERSLPPSPEQDGARLLWSRDRLGRWLVLSQRGSEPALVQRLDADRGALAVLAEIAGVIVLDLETLLDGGFVVLAADIATRKFGPGMIAFDERGTRSWSVPGDPEGIGRPAALAVTSEGEIAALDPAATELWMFDAHGRFLRRASVADAVGDRPVSALGLVRDVAGGVVVLEAGAYWRPWHVDRAGATRLDTRPTSVSEPWWSSRHAGLVRVAADGRLWTSDGSRFARLDEAQGTARDTFGDAAQPASIQPREIEVDALGRILVLAGSGADVEVFDAGGRSSFRCTAEVIDLPLSDKEALGKDLLAFDRDGVILSAIRGDAAVRWDGSGRRTGRVPWSGVRASALGDGLRWVLVANADALEVASLGGGPRPPIQRRADGRWFRSVLRIASSRAGELAVFDLPGIGVPTDVGATLSLFDAQANPERVIDVPYVDWTQIARTSRWIAGCDGAGPAVLLVDAKSGRVASMPLDRPSGSQTSWSPFFSPDESELWLIEKQSLRLRRYAVPH